MLPVYSPRDVSVSFSGEPIIGFATDSFIRLRRNSDFISETVGAKGELSLTRVADRTGEVEIELMQTSPSNLWLAGQLQAIENGAGLIVAQLLIQDPSGSVLALARNAYPKMYPEVELGADQNSKVWTFGCEILDYTSVPEGLSQELPTLALPV